MQKYLFILSTALLSTSVFANPAIQQQQQAVGYYMSTCGGPTPAHCTSNSGGGNNNGYYNAPVVAMVWAFDNAKATNVPLFYTVYALKGHGYTGSLLSKYGEKHCQETYGGRCWAAEYAHGNNYYLAIASTHPKGTAKDISTSGWGWGDSKKEAKKGALEECRAGALEKGHNPNDCKIILNKRLDKLGSEVPSKKIAQIL